MTNMHIADEAQRSKESLLDASSTSNSRHASDRMDITYSPQKMTYVWHPNLNIALVSGAAQN